MIHIQVRRTQYDVYGLTHYNIIDFNQILFQKYKFRPNHSSMNMIHHWIVDALFNFFRLACILTTLSLVIWCGYEFSKNEDVCEVLFKSFHQDEDSIYPDLIFGLPNRFDGTALRTYNESFNEDNYRDFLLGRNGSDNWNE